MHTKTKIIVSPNSEIIRYIEQKYVDEEGTIDLRNALLWPLKRHGWIISMIRNKHWDRSNVIFQAEYIINAFISKKSWIFPLTFLCFLSNNLKNEFWTEIINIPLSRENKIIAIDHVDVDCRKYTNDVVITKLDLLIHDKFEK